MCLSILKIQWHCLHQGITCAENDSTHFLPALVNNVTATKIFLAVYNPDKARPLEAAPVQRQ
jgi:hypothetical protein